MVELSNIELIEKYVNYELTDAEQRLLQNRLQNNIDFKMEFELAVFLHAQDRIKQRAYYKEIITRSNDEELAAIDESTNETPDILLNKKRQTGKSALLLKARWFRIAAILVVVPLVAVLIYHNETNSLAQWVDNELLTNSNINIPLLINRGVDPHFNSIYEEAVNAYNEKEFKSACFSFKKTEDKLNFKQRYQYAKSLLHAGYYEEAILQFDKITGAENNFQNDSEWLKVLALLKLNENAKAKIILIKLEEIEDFRDVEIKALLKKL